MTNRNIGLIVLACAVLIGISVFITHDNKASDSQNAVISAPANPALSVSVIQPESDNIPISLTANGAIAPWQEAIIGAEVGDLRLNAINVQVGDKVKKGQVLATFIDESVLIDIAQSKATLLEAEANQSEAQINAERAANVSASGALSAQQINQYQTLAKTAQAKVALAKAQLDAQLLRLKHTQVLASDDGIISSSTATLGAVANRGQELFKLIRQNRLEWRGEVTATDIKLLKSGIKVTVVAPNVGSINGTVRHIAPILNLQNRNGLVYVDIPNAENSGLRAGMFAQGEFNLGHSTALTVPQDALSLREGFSYVFVLSDQTDDRARVKQVKVELGRRFGNKLEILTGIKANDRLVANGAAFLTDGDSIRVVTQ